jgi:hypothetical protein
MTTMWILARVFRADKSNLLDLKNACDDALKEVNERTMVEIMNNFYWLNGCCHVRGYISRLMYPGLSDRSCSLISTSKQKPDSDRATNTRISSWHSDMWAASLLLQDRTMATFTHSSLQRQSSGLLSVLVCKWGLDLQCCCFVSRGCSS